MTTTADDLRRTADEVRLAPPSVVPPTPSAVRRLAPLALIVVAFWLRAWGINAQLPWEFHPDEAHYVWKAVDMVQEGNLNPKYFRNPSLYTYLLYVQFRLLGALNPPIDSLAQVWEALRPPSLFVWLGRLTTALLGAVTVVLVYRLGSKLLSPAAGLVGGLLLAISFLHVRDSQFATNDVPATLLLVASVACSASLACSRRSRDALLAGALGGLATSTKYNAGLFLVPLVLAHAIAFRRRVLRPRPLALLAGGGLLSVVAYLIGTPFTLLAWPTFRDDFLVQRRFARQGWEGQGPDPVGLLYLDALGQGLGWVMLGLAVLGLLLMARRRPVAAAMIAGYPLAYLAFMLGVKLFFVRFAVPAAPFLCLAAAYGGLELARLGRTRARQVGLASLITIAAIAQPLWNDFQHHRVMAQADTRALAYGWLEANVTPGGRIVVDEYTVRDRRPRADMPDRGRFDLDIVNALSEHDLDYYRAQGYQYAVSSSFEYQRFAGRFDIYGELDRRARLLAALAPTADGGDLPFDIEDLYSPFHDLARRERPGPTVKIYAIQ